MSITKKGGIIVDTSNQITINSTELYSQNNGTIQSGTVALTMGVGSIIFLFIVSFVLATLHYFCA